MSHIQTKLENAERLAELRPEETLKKIGLGEHDIICDIGAGSGIFTIPAAKITSNSVFALDINDELLGVITEKAREESLTNIFTVKVTGDGYNIETGSVDFVMLVAVLHEINNKANFLAEIKRIVKSTGKLVVIEFHKQQTPMGPPVIHRISRDEVAAICNEYGFRKSDEFSMGDNYYCLVLKK